jgi:ABC-type lipoprotein release transport system permease subunit
MAERFSNFYQNVTIFDNFIRLNSVTGVMIALALITTTLRIWSAANANPVDSLRSQ